MAHARRKIHDVHARTPTDITTEALKRIGKLYAIEAEIRGSPADERLAVRKEQTIPLMQSLYDWIQVQMKVLSRHSGHGEGVRLPAEAVGRIKPVLQQWLGGDRQQYRGERAAWRSPGPEKLAVRRFRYRRRTCGDPLLSDRHLPA